MIVHQLCCREVVHDVDDLKGHVGHHLGPVVGLHGVPVVEALSFERFNVAVYIDKVMTFE